MLKSQISLSESSIPEVFIRIIPRYLGTDRKELIINTSYFRIFLERGLQVMGKSSPIRVPDFGKKSQFRSEDKFSFQILNEKSLEYMFAIYAIDQAGNEQRLQSTEYSVQKHYQTFVRQGKKQFPQQICFSNQKVTLRIILIISTAIQVLSQQSVNLFPSQSRSKMSGKTGEKDSMQKIGNSLKVVSTELGSEKLDQDFPHQSDNPLLSIQFIKGSGASSSHKYLPSTIGKKAKIEKEQLIEQTQKLDGQMGKITLVIIFLIVVLGLLGGSFLTIDFGKKSKKKLKIKKSKVL